MNIGDFEEHKHVPEPVKTLTKDKSDVYELKLKKFFKESSKSNDVKINSKVMAFDAECINPIIPEVYSETPKKSPNLN